MQLHNLKKTSNVFNRPQREQYFKINTERKKINWSKWKVFYVLGTEEKARIMEAIKIFTS